MADCWRKLAEKNNVSLRVIIQEFAEPGTAFKVAEVMRGLDYVVVGEEAAENENTLEQLVPWTPDAMFIVGWHARTCVAFATSKKWKSVPKVCVFDMPWQWRLRKIVARFALGRYLRNFDVAFVPGQVAARYAKWLGFKRIEKGLFSINTAKFNVCGSVDGPDKPYFLYAGRNSPEKRLDVLRKAYEIYAGKVDDPWPLKLFGKGLPDGFVQPVDLPALYGKAGAFVLASDFDPWPLVIAESCASGLPVICTDKCTNHFELIRENGIVVPSGNASAFADAMVRIHSMTVAERKERGAKGCELVMPYDCARWAQHVVEIAGSLT